MREIIEYSKKLVDRIADRIALALPDSKPPYPRDTTPRYTAKISNIENQYCHQSLKGDHVAIIGQNAAAIHDLMDQVTYLGGHCQVFHSPEAFLASITSGGVGFDVCLMIQDDFNRREYSVLDIAVKTKSLSPFTSVFGLSELVRMDDVGKSCGQIIDGMIKLPANPFSIMRALT